MKSSDNREFCLSRKLALQSQPTFIETTWPLVIARSMRSSLNLTGWIRREFSHWNMQPLLLASDDTTVE